MKTIRLFLSSTFRDMHAERDHLNRLVFPELRQRCERVGVDFVAVDLRWGITEEDARRHGALELCLGEIERCRPFFLALLGERYGWAPPPDTIPVPVFKALRLTRREAALVDDCYRLDDTARRPAYRLRRDRVLSEEESRLLLSVGRRAGLPGMSITEQEIHRALARTAGAGSHGLFYLRRSGLARHPDFPAALQPAFVEASRERRHALAELKAHIATLGRPHVVRHYEARYDGLRIDATYLPDELSAAARAALADRVIRPAEWPALEPRLRDALVQHGTPALAGLEAFGAMVQQDLQAQIDAMLGARGRARRAVPLDAQERFVAARTRLFVGRTQELARLQAYLNADAAGHVLTVTGEPGCGKSALLAEFVARVRRRRARLAVVACFVGAAPGSAELTTLLRDILVRLKAQCGLDEPLPDDPAELRRALGRWLEAAGARRPVLLVVDALNQLEPGHRSHELDWLPLELPQGVHGVVSTTAGRCLEVLEQRGPPDHRLEVGTLAAPERREIVERQLARHGKRLDAAHLARLLDTAARPDARLPLYLLVALHELCLFGDYDGLDRRLGRLPPRVDALFEQVLQRLELDHGAALCTAACRCLAAARSGLAETELLDVLGRAGVVVSRLDWTRFYRALEPYLQPMDDDGGGLLDFFHEQLRLAVLRRCFGMAAPGAPPTAAWRRTHRGLAASFAGRARDDARRWRADAGRALSELPFHLRRAAAWPALVRTLGDLQYIEAACVAGLSYALVAVCDDSLREMPTDDPARLERLADVARFVRRSSHQLARHADQPGFVIQHAHHQAADGPVAAAADALLRAGAAGRDAVFLLAAAGSRPPHQPRPAIVRTFAGRGEDDTKIAMSPDGRIAISTSVDELVVWDLATGEPIRPLRDGDRAHAVALSADGRIAVAGSGDERVRVWDVTAGQCLRRLHGHRDFVVAIAMTPDARRAVSGSQDGSIVLWDVRSGRRLWRFEPGEGESEHLALAPDGRRLVCGGQDGLLRLIDLDERKTVGEWRHGDGSISCVAITPDGTRAIAVGDDGDVSIWALPGGQPVQRVKTRNALVQGIAVTADSARLVVGGMSGLELIELGSGRLLKTLGSTGGSVGGVTGLCVTADGRFALSASYDGELNLWDLHAPGSNRADDPRADGAERRVRWVAIAPDLRHAACAGDDVVEILSLGAGAPAAARTIPVPGDIPTEPAFTADGSLVVFGSEAGPHHGAIGAASVASGAPRWSALRHEDYVASLALTPDGRVALSAGDDGALRSWDLDGLEALGRRSGEPIARLTVVVGPDGCTVCSAQEHDFGDDQTIYVWHLRSGKVLRRLRGHDAPVYVMALSPDGRCLASAGLDDTIRLWDLAAGTLLRELPGHANEVSGLAFLADGRSLLSAGEDRTVRIWDLPTGRCRNVLAMDYPVVALVSRGRHVALVLKGGHVKWLDLHDKRATVPVATAVRAYLHDRHEWESVPRVSCPACGARSGLGATAAAAIARAASMLKPGVPPALQLPDAAYQDAALLSRCAACGTPLRLNPFVAG